MPGMDGVSLSNLVKQDPLLSGTHIIMMISLGDTRELTKYDEVGFDSFINKPVRQNELLTCLLRSMLNGR